MSVRHGSLAERGICTAHIILYFNVSICCPLFFTYICDTLYTCTNVYRCACVHRILCNWFFMFLSFVPRERTEKLRNWEIPPSKGLLFSETEYCSRSKENTMLKVILALNGKNMLRQPYEKNRLQILTTHSIMYVVLYYMMLRLG